MAGRKGHYAKGKRQRAMAYWRVHRAEGRGQVAKGRRQRADGTEGTRTRSPQIATMREREKSMKTDGGMMLLKPCMMRRR